MISQIKKDKNRETEFLYTEKQKELLVDMLSAFYSGSLNKVKEVLRAGFDINYRSHTGYTCLFHAVPYDIKILRYLLKSGADISVVENHEGNSLLHQAVIEGKTEALILFIKNNADIYKKNKDNQTPFALSLLRTNLYPLHIQSYTHYYNTISTISDILVLSGYVPSEEDFNDINDSRKDFLKEKYTAMAKLDEETKKNMLYKIELNERLLQAILSENLEEVKEAIASGADIKYKDSNGNTLLKSAIWENKGAEILEYLLECGADPNVQGDNGDTALHTASYCEYFDRIELLLKHNADMSIKNNMGSTAFVICTASGRNDIAELFILNGYIPTKEDYLQLKNAELFDAIEYNIDINAVKEAIKNGADINAVNRHGSNAFAVSLNNRFYTASEVLVLNGYVPSEEDFKTIKNITERGSLKTRFMTLTAQVQEHNAKLTEETKATEFTYADEIIEM